MPHYEIKHLLPVFSRMRRAVAVAVLVGVAVAPAWRRNVLTTFPFVKTANAEAPRIETSRRQKSPLTDGGAMPELEAIGWLNSAPLQRKSPRGKIVLVDFWTYTCINSLRPLPYLKSWEAKYKDAGLIVIGVHTPEFSFEKTARTSKTPCAI